MGSSACCCVRARLAPSLPLTPTWLIPLQVLPNWTFVEYHYSVLYTNMYSIAVTFVLIPIVFRIFSAFLRFNCWNHIRRSQYGGSETHGAGSEVSKWPNTSILCLKHFNQFHLWSVISNLKVLQFHKVAGLEHYDSH